MFLARAQGLQVLHDAKDEHGVLDGEGSQESGAGPGGLAAAGGEGMVGHHRLGVRAEEGGAGGNGRPCPGGDPPERRALSLRPGGKTPCPRGLSADAQAAAGEGSGPDGRAQGTLISHPSKLSQSFSVHKDSLRENGVNAHAIPLALPADFV